MVEDTESQYLLIICVWQVGAKALLTQYKDLASNIPQGANIEVLVMDKKDLMEKFLVPEDLQCTTNEINRLCQNIGTRVKDKQVSLFIDECWVTAPVQYSAHLTTVSFVKCKWNVCCGNVILNHNYNKLLKFLRNEKKFVYFCFPIADLFRISS